MAQCYCKILRGPTPAKINILLLREKAKGRGNVISKIRNSFVTSIFVSRPSLNDKDVAVDGTFDRMIQFWLQTVSMKVVDVKNPRLMAI